METLNKRILSLKDEVREASLRCQYQKSLVSVENEDERINQEEYEVDSPIDTHFLNHWDNGFVNTWNNWSDLDFPKYKVPQ
jgi:hypothetical protein